MSGISLPTKVEFRQGKEQHQAQLIVEPCFPGYGVTLGNALRRVLLSSLPGAAVTSVKIKGVNHEFSTLPHMKEDLIELILNIKRLRLKLFRQETIQLTLHAEGEREVRAKDIDASADAEVGNPDLLLATLTDKSAKLDIEFTVEPGYGYVPIEAREKGQKEIGVIAVDAIFTPIRNTGFQIEPVRVGQMTNYERLLLNIETDGTITPQEAIQHSAKLLLDHFGLFTLLSQEGEHSESEEKDNKTTQEESVIAPEVSFEEESETQKEVAKEEIEETPAEAPEAPAPKKRGRPKKTTSK